MKAFKSHNFDFTIYQKELLELKDLLNSKEELSENNEILPFFRTRPKLSTQIATLLPRLTKTDRFAFEFDLFGDFVADLAIGDTHSNTFCFIEFENAKEESIFKKVKKYKPEFSPTFEHGLSQIIDWFYKIDGLQNTDDLEERFGKNKIEYEGILIIGRDRFLDASLKKRLDWRTRKTVVNSKHIYSYTFDELYLILEQRIEMLKVLIN